MTLDAPPRLPRTLYIVQNHEALGRSWARYFEQFFANVASTARPEAVQAWLDDAPKMPVDVVCGAAFDDDDGRSGLQWVKRFHAHPAVSRVVLATAAPIARCAEADLIVHKPMSPARILSFLQGEPARGAA
ncbi:MAG: hypothetical protein AAGN82_28760 [Myxococcota bacterium]